MEHRRDDLRSAMRTGGALSWPAVVEHVPSHSPHVLAQPERRSVTTRTNRGPQFSVPLFHILATTIPQEANARSSVRAKPLNCRFFCSPSVDQFEGDDATII